MKFIRKKKLNELKIISLVGLGRSGIEKIMLFGMTWCKAMCSAYLVYSCFEIIYARFPRERNLRHIKYCVFSKIGRHFFMPCRLSL